MSAQSPASERTKDVLISAAAPLLLLVLWEWAGRNGTAPSYLSFPSAIGAAFMELARKGEYFSSTWISLLRAYFGFAIGATLGVCLGLLAATQRHVREFFDPIVSFLYPVPKIAFLPVLLLTFGIGDGSKVALIALSVFFPLFMSARQSLPLLIAISFGPRATWAPVRRRFSAASCCRQSGHNCSQARASDLRLRSLCCSQRRSSARAMALVI